MGDDLSRERGKKDKKRMRLRGIEPLTYTRENKGKCGISSHCMLI